ncbi:uncharacterized protein BP01DRAFT_422612 [Aspergillus saccharolyticus JOP 1030-1]|uniref:Uncharacterized protein n=1 Tax=Aspergillus saccharolyticus JOP 1030-1 TaxID=1450539 RepID=A0A318ZIB5_9EURO|nr:hypothetical protein BP01DRAFT_422612 [Aspergillus saccharolyticus JOP 1030-1]PYH46665.1 hypothetical protein BP01DRAFT_422612 [Aspergillus saccharolyticus JOP 1030-1]
MSTQSILARLLRSPIRSTAIPSVTRRAFTTTRTKLHAPKDTSSAYKDGVSRYKLFVSPFAKVFLGAVFTFQVLHWTWLKLEMDDSKYEKNKEVAALEEKARELTGTQKKV